MRWTRPAADQPRQRPRSIARSPARSARRSRARAGFSLFEVLVAIGILVAIAAIALPWAWSRLSARDLPESAETLTAILMLARAEAMSSGRLVEVRVRRGESDPSIEVRSTFLDPDRLSLGESSGSELDEAFGFEAEPREDDPAVQPIGASWAVRRLPAGIGLRPIGSGSRAEFEEPDAAIEFAGADLIEALDDEPISIDEGPIDRPIAIYLPDGSNMLAGSWWLEEMPADGMLPAPEDDDRRRLRLSLGDPSGVPRWGEIERVVPRGGMSELDRETNTEAPREPAEAKDPPGRDRGAERRSDRAGRDEGERGSEAGTDEQDQPDDTDDEESTP